MADDQQGIEHVGDAERLAAAERERGGFRLAEREDGLVAGDDDRQAAERAQRPERHDERRQPQIGDQVAVDRAGRKANADRNVAKITNQEKEYSHITKTSMARIDQIWISPLSPTKSSTTNVKNKPS